MIFLSALRPIYMQINCVGNVKNAITTLFASKKKEKHSDQQ